jgi:hypothetical protein
MNIRQIIFTSVFIAFFMSVIIAFVMTVVNVGFSSYFPTAWLTGFGIGFAVSLPLAFLLPWIAGKIIKLLKI